MLRAFGHPVGTCCVLLPVVGSNLKMVKFFTQHLWILHDVVVVWPRLARFVQQCSFFWNTSLFLLSPGQTIATFQRNTSQHCWIMLRHVAKGWPNACNMLRPTLFGYECAECCDRLAGVLKWAYQNSFSLLSPGPPRLAFATCAFRSLINVLFENWI